MQLSRWSMARAVMTMVGVSLVASACTSSEDDPTVSAPSSRSGSVPASSGASSSTTTSPGATSSSTSAAPVPVTVTATAATTKLNPTTRITVTAAHGTLHTVTLKNVEGKKVAGVLSADKSNWHSTEDLGYSKTYKLVAKAGDSSGEVTENVSRKYTTLTPDNMTMPYLNTIYGNSLVNGATYGVGMIPVVNFDESIPDKAAAEKALVVTTSPHVDGSWTWANDHQAHWRPRNYYTPGTKVTITAKVYGVDVGNGMYGQADQRVSYKIGAKQVAIADAKTHQVKVYFNDKLKRTMPTSMGMGGSTTGKNGQTIYFWTMPGTYTVIGHENPATMSSDSYGLPANSQFGYAAEKVPYSTKISTDGIYLHQLNTTVWAQGHQNVSHGCLNLNDVNAKWYFSTSRVGDIVKVVNSGGPKLQLWQGGDWTLSWKEWKAGSALS